MSASQSGGHNDVHDIKDVVEIMFDDLDKANIKTDGLLISAAAGFDCDVLRDCPDRNGVVANICISKRLTETDNISIDGKLYAE